MIAQPATTPATRAAAALAAATLVLTAAEEIEDHDHETLRCSRNSEIRFHLPIVACVRPTARDYWSAMRRAVVVLASLQRPALSPCGATSERHRRGSEKSGAGRASHRLCTLALLLTIREAAK